MITAKLTIATLVLIGLTGCGGGDQSSSAAECPASIDSAVALKILNSARSESRMCGTKLMNAAPPLEWDNNLQKAAKNHSQDMADRKFFAHTNPDGKTTSERTLAAGYGPTTGENLAAGYSGIETVMNKWLGSAEHCENIMNRDYKHYALACSDNKQSEYGSYWVQNFGIK